VLIWAQSGSSAGDLRVPGSGLHTYPPPSSCILHVGYPSSCHDIMQPCCCCWLETRPLQRCVSCVVHAQPPASLSGRCQHHGMSGALTDLCVTFVFLAPCSPGQVLGRLGDIWDLHRCGAYPTKIYKHYHLHDNRLNPQNDDRFFHG
jgi:hypothetical protein